MAPDPDHPAAAGDAGGGGDLLERVVDLAIRLGRAWRALSRERRRAAIAAAILWLTLFLPWYQASVIRSAGRDRGPVPGGESMSGWGAFSLVEGAILIISLGVVFLMFLRAEGRASQLPRGDGWIVTVAGGLSVLLVIWGMFNAPAPSVRGQYVLSTGLEWGIFAALLAAAALAYAGSRLRLAGLDEPVRAPDDEAVFDGRWREPGEAAEVTGHAARVGGKAARPGGNAARPGGNAARTGAATADPDPASAARRDPPPPAARSSWRPAERPAWSESDRPVGWLTAPPKHLRDNPGHGAGEAAAAPPPPDTSDTVGQPPPQPVPHRAPSPEAPKPEPAEQLTIRLEADE